MTKSAVVAVVAVVALVATLFFYEPLSFPMQPSDAELQPTDVNAVIKPLRVNCPTERRFRTEGEVNPLTGLRYPNVLLYSYEGSGNSWTRVMFENATGAWPCILLCIGVVADSLVVPSSLEVLTLEEPLVSRRHGM